MTTEEMLDYLFIISIVFSVVLMMLSLMAVGKHTADLQYQLAKQLNGIRWIQSWINLRIHGNRVFFATAFLATSILGLIDNIDPILRMWIGRTLFLGVLFAFLASAVLDWLAEAKQLRILLKYEEVNKVSEMRYNLHRLNNTLGRLYGHLDLDIKVDDQTKGEINELQEEIILLVKAVQHDLHLMDPSYKTTKKAADVNTAE